MDHQGYTNEQDGHKQIHTEGLMLIISKEYEEK